jgi:hypothetical protein
MTHDKLYQWKHGFTEKNKFLNIVPILGIGIENSLKQKQLKVAAIFFDQNRKNNQGFDKNKVVGSCIKKKLLAY